MAAEKPSSKGQAWFCTIGLPSDVVIEVDDMTFHLHKFPLMSKSRKLRQLITEQEKNPTQTQIQATSEPDNKAHEEEIEEEDREEEEKEDQYCYISLSDFPGGSETFETAAKFSYGVKIEMSSSNVAPLRCAGEFLEMTEDYSEDNLISKTERFLSQSVLKSLRDSIRTLNSCEKLLPVAETLGIVQRCIDSISATASSTAPDLFGWPVNDNSAVVSKRLKNQVLEIGARRKGLPRGNNGPDAWFEELGHLSLPLFKRLILAMKARDINPEVIESCLIYFAKKSIPGISRSTRKPSSSNVPSENEQRELIETIIANFPKEKNSGSSTSTRFLFGLLKTANILKVSETHRAALEKKIGSQLEQATLDDLLIPSYSYLNETLYDVDCVERILVHFLDRLEERSSIITEGEDENSSVRSAELMLVGKLIDGYLSEIGSDANLKIDKFYELAVSLPKNARLFDDGLYRAVDVYLTAHPYASEAEREKLCGLIDCQKLTLEACTHSAQNNRLPLRAVVQVLFFEQLQLRQAIAGTLLAADIAPVDTIRPSNLQEVEDGGVGVSRAQEGSSTWRAMVRENQVLRLDMDSMRTRVHQLERECSTIKKVIDAMGFNGGGKGWKSLITSKFGCKFKTQVCDSHRPIVVGAKNRRAKS